MRTTLDVDEDVLTAVKSLAKSEGSTAGKVISQLARKALLPSLHGATPKTRNGVPLFRFPRKGKAKIVTMELINRMRDESE